MGHFRTIFPGEGYKGRVPPLSLILGHLRPPQGRAASSLAPSPGSWALGLALALDHLAGLGDHHPHLPPPRPGAGLPFACPFQVRSPGPPPLHPTGFPAPEGKPRVLTDTCLEPRPRCAPCRPPAWACPAAPSPSAPGAPPPEEKPAWEGDPRFEKVVPLCLNDPSPNFYLNST